MEIPVKSHGADREARARKSAVKLSHGKKASVEVVDESVHGVGSAMSPWMVVSLEELLSLGTELENGLLELRVGGKMLLSHSRSRRIL